MIYLTGDTHGEFSRLEIFHQRFSLTKEDTLIILGDAGVNYYGNRLDDMKKRQLQDLPFSIFCIHGNHEMRPTSCQKHDGKPLYREVSYRGGIAYAEEAYPRLLFAKDGEIYAFPSQNGSVKHCIAIGGAYSVDKFYRLKMAATLGDRGGYRWFSDEQPSDEIKARVAAKLAAVGNKIDVVLSHTCPFRYLPRECFLSGIDQSTVDSSTEKWLDEIEQRVDYGHWYCGHYHTDKSIDKLTFMFEQFTCL